MSCHLSHDFMFNFDHDFDAAALSDCPSTPKTREFLQCCMGVHFYNHTARA